MVDSWGVPRRVRRDCFATDEEMGVLEGFIFFGEGTRAPRPHAAP